MFDYSFFDRDYIDRKKFKTSDFDSSLRWLYWYKFRTIWRVVEICEFCNLSRILFAFQFAFEKLLKRLDIFRVQFFFSTKKYENRENEFDKCWINDNLIEKFEKLLNFFDFKFSSNINQILVQRHSRDFVKLIFKFRLKNRKRLTLNDFQNAKLNENKNMNELFLFDNFLTKKLDREIDCIRKI